MFSCTDTSKLVGIDGKEIDITLRELLLYPQKNGYSAPIWISEYILMGNNRWFLSHRHVNCHEKDEIFQVDKRTTNVEVRIFYMLRIISKYVKPCSS